MVKRASGRGRKALGWLLLYLWSVPLVLLLGEMFDWQYDGDLAWWLAAGYTAPVVMLTQPISGLVSFNYLAVGYLFLLAVTSLLFARDWL